MRMPLIVGLPGVGKSEVNDLLSDMLGVEIISTDHKFRELRAVPINDNRGDDAAVMETFLVQVRTDFVNAGRMNERQYAQLVAACERDPKDAKGRNSFRDSKVARSFGEDVFRTFEWVMNQHLNDNGAFDEKIVDISSSAALYKQNHAIFTRDKYLLVHLVAPHDVIVQNLVEGFRRHQQLSAETGELVPIRGAYETKVYEAIAKNGGVDSDEVVHDALSAYSTQHHRERIEHFARMAEYTVARMGEDTFADVAAKIVELAQRPAP